MTDFKGSGVVLTGVSTGGRSVGTGAGGGTVGVSIGAGGETSTAGGFGIGVSLTTGLLASEAGVLGVEVNPKVVSNSSLVKPFRTAIEPSSFSTRVTGVPAKLLEMANISVKKSLLVSKSFSSYCNLLVVKYSFSCLEKVQSLIV